MGRMQIGVLVSGSGSNLQAILDASSSGSIPVDVRLVISNKPAVLALERARSARVPSLVLSHKRFADREAFETELIEALRQHEVEWVALAGFMRVLTPHFLRAFPSRVVNIHPALLPSFPGVHAQRQALDYGVKLAGCTVHFVDEGTDTGPIIGQAVVPVLDTDDEEQLAARILEQEHRLYPHVLRLIAEGRVARQGRRVKVSAVEQRPFAQLNPPLDT
jgi:phosphoribosylglycinamide formyltransferase-1